MMNVGRAALDARNSTRVESDVLIAGGGAAGDRLRAAEADPRAAGTIPSTKGSLQG